MSNFETDAAVFETQAGSTHAWLVPITDPEELARGERLLAESEARRAAGTSTAVFVTASELELSFTQHPTTEL
jgi:hypothetical protein